MRFRTHIVISLLAALLIFPLFELNKGAFLIVFLFAALVPDIDASNSFVGKNVPFIGWVLRHRGVFHSLAMALALSFLVFALADMTYAIVFLLGYLTHLLVDMLTPEGIAPLYPLRYRIRGFIPTGSTAETVIFLVGMIVGFSLLLR